jgi:hypothetical protein
MGNFFFIIFDLLSVHVTGADRPNEGLLSMSAQGKDSKNAASGRGPADGDKPGFAVRMPGIGEHERTRGRKQNSLDLRNKNAVLAAFAPISAIPFKPDNLHIPEHQY